MATSTKRRSSVRASSDRRTDDKLWRTTFTRKVNSLEKNQTVIIRTQADMMELLQTNTKFTESIAADTAVQRDLTRCLRGAASGILWAARNISDAANFANRLLKPLLILAGCLFAIGVAGVALLNHGKVPDWAVKLLFAMLPL